MQDNEQFQNLQKNYDSLRRLHNSMVSSFEQLEKENLVLKNAIAILEAEKKQWEMSKILQQQIIQRTINISNATNNSYLEENNRLKEELRALKGK